MGCLLSQMMLLNERKIKGATDKNGLKDVTFEQGFILCVCVWHHGHHAKLYANALTNVDVDVEYEFSGLIWHWKLFDKNATILNNTKH